MKPAQFDVRLLVVTVLLACNPAPDPGSLGRPCDTDEPECNPDLQCMSDGLDQFICSQPCRTNADCDDVVDPPACVRCSPLIETCIAECY